MPLSSLDIWFCYTGVATGPANNTLSLGGSIPTSPVTIPDSVNNIFDLVTGDESAVGRTEYRGIAIFINTINSGGSFDAIHPRLWISGFVRAATGADTIGIAASTFGLNRTRGAVGMGSCATETSAPNETGLSWVNEGDAATIYWTAAGLPTLTPPSAGTLLSDRWVGIFLRRIVPAGASAFNNRVCTLTFQCETSASPLRYTITKNYEIRWTDSYFGVIPVQVTVQN